MLKLSTANFRLTIFFLIISLTFTTSCDDETENKDPRLITFSLNQERFDEFEGKLFAMASANDGSLLDAKEITARGEAIVLNAPSDYNEDTFIFSILILITEDEGYLGGNSYYNMPRGKELAVSEVRFDYVSNMLLNFSMFDTDDANFYKMSLPGFSGNISENRTYSAFSTKQNASIFFSRYDFSNKPDAYFFTGEFPIEEEEDILLSAVSSAYDEQEITIPSGTSELSLNLFGRNNTEEPKYAYNLYSRDYDNSEIVNQKTDLLKPGDNFDIYSSFSFARLGDGRLFSSRKSQAYNFTFPQHSLEVNQVSSQGINYTLQATNGFATFYFGGEKTTANGTDYFDWKINSPAGSHTVKIPEIPSFILSEIPSYTQSVWEWDEAPTIEWPTENNDVAFLVNLDFNDYDYNVPLFDFDIIIYGDTPRLRQKRNINESLKNKLYFSNIRERILAFDK